MSELRECPFCGSDAALIEEEDIHHYSLPFSVQCCDIDACRDGDLWFVTAEEAIEHWNNRPIEDELRAEIISLRERLAQAEGKAESLNNAIQCYEGFIGYIKSFAHVGLTNPNMSRRMVLKQIHARIKWPLHTQLEEARNFVAQNEEPVDKKGNDEQN